MAVAIRRAVVVVARRAVVKTVVNAVAITAGITAVAIDISVFLSAERRLYRHRPSIFILPLGGIRAVALARRRPTTRVVALRAAVASADAVARRRLQTTMRIITQDSTA